MSEATSARNFIRLVPMAPYLQHLPCKFMSYTSSGTGPRMERESPIVVMSAISATSTCMSIISQVEKSSCSSTRTEQTMFVDILLVDGRYLYHVMSLRYVINFYWWIQ